MAPYVISKSLFSFLPPSNFHCYIGQEGDEKCQNRKKDKAKDGLVWLMLEMLFIKIYNGHEKGT